MKLLGPPDRVPMPARVKWRIVRERILPLLVLLVVAGVIVQLWGQYARPIDLIGEAVGARVAVASPAAGVLAQWYVQPFATVQKGEPVAVVITTDPALIEAKLAVFRAEMELLRLNREPLTGRQRADLDYEGLRLDWLSLRAEQAVTRILHARAQQQYRRSRPLYERELISADEVEALQSAWAALTVELRERESNLLQLEAQLERLAWPELDPEELMRSALNLHQQRLRALELELEPVIVRAPMDGVAGGWQRRPGEVIATGEELMTVMSETADHVVAYLRQPLRARPALAADVVVQNAGRQRGVGQVTHVAPHLVLLPEHMALPGARPEMALQVYISIPEGMSVQPGERVNLELAARAL